MRVKKHTNNYLGRNLNKVRTNDKIDVVRRSGVMSKIRSSGTALERFFIDEFKCKCDAEFNTNFVGLKGKPDLVFHKSMVCVFIDSDFWHGWQLPRWRHLLKNEFWVNKIEKNRQRDIKTTRYLRRHGWVVVRIWEHNIKKDIDAQIGRIISKINV